VVDSSGHNGRATTKLAGSGAVASTAISNDVISWPWWMVISWPKA
jgi:hypothetical protein